jgi:uroporphyrinogen decarboxylase
MAAMTSRERVVTALDHREPDRVPFDCPLSYGQYEMLRKHLGYGDEVKPGSSWLSVQPPVDFALKFDMDLYYIGLNKQPGAPKFEYGMETYTDEWGVTYQRAENPTGYHYDFAVNPLKDATIDDLADYPWPDPHDPALADGLAEKCRYLYENTDFALVGKFSNSIFEQAFYLRGYEQLFIDLAANREFACALLDRLTDIAIARAEVGIRACGPYIQIARLAGDDMGHQQGTLLSPRMFRQLIKPRFARLYKTTKQLLHQYNPNGKLMAHTDGDVYPIIPDYIEMGLDVLNPVQPYVAEMDHDRLKAEFGDRLSFHAAIDIQHVLPFGTPEEVRAEAVKTMRALGRNGGYILAPTHYVQPDVPPENVVALHDAVMECGSYPLQ